MARAARRTVRRVVTWVVGSLLAMTASLAGLGWLTGALDGTQSALNNDGLPFYTDASLRPRWDRWASWQRIAGFSLTDQRDRAIDQRLLEQRPTVVGYFYTGCTSVCPVSLGVLRALDERLSRLQDSARPQFLLLTTSPEFDTPASLADYARRLQLPEAWVLATGRPAAVHGLAASLMSELHTAADGAPPAHAQRAFLLDGERRIRGVYDATSMPEMRRMAADCERLLAERAPGRRAITQS